MFLQEDSPPAACTSMCAAELKALHERFVELYMKQPEDCCFSFFHQVVVPVCVKMSSSSRGRAKVAGMTLSWFSSNIRPCWGVRLSCLLYWSWGTIKQSVTAHDWSRYHPAQWCTLLIPPIPFGEAALDCSAAKLVTYATS